MSRFVKIVALGLATAGVLALSAGSATAENRQGSQPPQSVVTVA